LRLYKKHRKSRRNISKKLWKKQADRVVTGNIEVPVKRRRALLRNNSSRDNRNEGSE
jgi:hypothetical protein